MLKWISKIIVGTGVTGIRKSSELKLNSTMWNCHTKRLAALPLEWTINLFPPLIWGKKLAYFYSFQVE